MQRRLVRAGPMVALALGVALGVAACGSSGSGSSSNTTHPKQSTTSSSSARGSTTTTAAGTPTTASGPMTTASLPLIVCNSTSGATTTTTSLPASVSVSVPASSAQQGSLAVYSDAAGRLMLVGPTSGWTCSASFGADGSGTMALLPVGTSLPANTTDSWHLPAGSPMQAITAVETGGSSVNGASLACPLFSGALATTKQNLGQGCAPDPTQEHVQRSSASEATFQDPPGVAGVGIPSGGQNQANGVMLYQAKAGEATTYLATCTLPASQQDLCTAVLNHFVTNFG